MLYADRPAGLGGIETHVDGLAFALARSGFEVTIAFSRISDPSLFRRAIEAGVTVTEADGDAVLKLVRQERVDLLHAHSHGASRVARTSHARWRIPTVVTVHGPAQSVPLGAAPGIGIICVSEEVARPLRAAFGTRLEVIENGIDLSRFKPPRSGARPPIRSKEKLQIAYLGRVGPAKKRGLEALWEAMSPRPEVELTFISNWAPHGHARPTHDVAAALSRYDLVLSTGRGVREAMASGAAAAVLGVYWDGLVTPQNVQSLRWHNFSGRTHRLVPSAGTLASEIRPLLTDRARLGALAAFACEYAHAHFGEEPMLQKTLQIYQRVTSEVG